MDKGRSNMLDKKVDLKDCKKLLENAEEIIQCPVCMENSEKMEQCIAGHLICVQCKGKIGTNSCPICKKIYSGTKSFIMPDLSKTLSALKISLDTLENDLEQPKNVEAYRNLIRTILTKMSIFFNNTSTTFQKLDNYLQNSNHINRKELDDQIASYATQLRSVKYFMDNTKDTLIALKK